MNGEQLSGLDNGAGVGNTGDGQAADTLIFDVSMEDFADKVIHASTQVPVLVDFWAPWCEPCKQLRPLLEKIVNKAKGKVKLAKMDIDKYPQLAGQLGIRSIPAVIAFKNGQPVDGFTGAVPDSQITSFIERLAGPVGPSEGENLVAAGKEALAEGNFDAGLNLFNQAIEIEPENKAAYGGIIQALTRTAKLDEAREFVDALSKDMLSSQEVSAAVAALELAEQSTEIGDDGAFIEAIEKNPNDHTARLNLALALNARNDREGAVDQLIEIVKRDRQWQEDEGRKQLLKLFESWGMTDEATLYGRRQLSSILFS